jgi:D-tyrosyl-tRNA(Tyr) deacylase
MNVGYHTSVEGTEKMRLILQRVSSASVEVQGEVISAIERGLLVLVGIEHGDGAAQVEAAAAKMAGLRIFDDQSGRMNLDVRQVDAAILLVSQFTLAGSLTRGRRPSFDGAAPPEVADRLIEELAERLRDLGIPVAMGRFGARMEVALVNAGPVTFVLDVPCDARA